MAQIWPATLQQCLNEQDFGLTFGDTTVETEMGVGLPKKRRRYTKGVDTIQGSIDIENDLYATFESFFKTTLNGGVDTFLYDHPVTKVETEFQFIGVPSVRSIGGKHFRISMTWRVIP